MQVVRGLYYQQNWRTSSAPCACPRRAGCPLVRESQCAGGEPAAYDLGLYLQELSPAFEFSFTNQLAAYRKAKIKLTRAQRATLAQFTRYSVASNIVAKIGSRIAGAAGR